MMFFYNGSDVILLIMGLLFALWALVKMVVIVNQFERGVVLTLGRYSGTCEPGLRLLVPVVQQMRRADMRVTVTEVEPQDLITKDNVAVKVSAVTYFRVVDARKALLEVRNYMEAISQVAQVTLRSTIGHHSLDELLSQQEKLNDMIKANLDARTEEWGVQVDQVEIRSVDLDASMVRAMAQEAEAERGRRARVITADGEYQAAEKLAQAAEILARNPAALTLRTLATLKEIGAEQNTMILFPVAQDVLAPNLNPTILAASAAMAHHKPKD